MFQAILTIFFALVGLLASASSRWATAVALVSLLLVE